MSDDHHIVPWTHYAYNFTALMILMTATVVVSYYDLGVLNLPIALAIAITKAVLIVLIFMNVRNGSHLVWVFAAGGFIWFCIMLGFTLTDFAAEGLGTPYIDALPSQQ